MNEQAIAVLTQEVTPVYSLIPDVILTQKDMEKAAKLLSELNRFSDKVKIKKEELTKPLNAALKSWRDLFKPLEVQQEEKIQTLRTLMSKYQTAADAKAKAAEQKIVERVGDGRGHLSGETAVRKLGEIERPEEKIVTAAGSVSFSEVKKFEIVDATTLAKNKIFIAALFTAADTDGLLEKLIRKFMKENIEFEGVRYFTEKVVINKR